MKEAFVKHRTPIIILAAILLIGIGIAVGIGIMSSMSVSKGSSYIDKEAAKTICLQSAGVSASKATFTKAEFDREDGAAIYEIEFYSGVNEYEFEVDAKNGTILEKKSKALSRVQQPSAAVQEGTLPGANSSSGQTSMAAGSSSDYIGIDRAKSIALKHAGISASSATFTKAKLDTDDGIRTYEIEFIAGDREYEYEINASTGDLLDVSSEYLDDYDYSQYHHQENGGHHGVGAGAGRRDCPYPGCEL